MQYLNLHLPLLRGPEFLGSSPAERGTWLCVFAYCADQENGGRMIGAAKWKDRQWQQVCGVTSREVRASSRLLTVESDDVVVFGYPTDKEKLVQAKRNRATAASRARWTPSSNPKSDPKSDSEIESDHGMRKGIGKEEEEERKSPRTAREPERPVSNQPTQEEVRAEFHRCGGLEAWADKWFGEREATGWLLNSSPIREWRKLVPHYAKACRARENTSRTAPRPVPPQSKPIAERDYSNAEERLFGPKTATP